MPPTVLIVAAAILGHLSLLILATNVSHGLGVTWRGFERATLVALAVGALVAIGLGWALLAVDRADWPMPLRLYVDACVLVGAVILPAATVIRMLRKPPPGITGNFREIDLAAAERGGADALIGEGRFAGALRWPGNGSFRLRVECWDVEVPGLPPALEGLSVLHLTDLHFATCFRKRFFEAVVEEAMRERPDLVAFTGDLVDADEAIEWVVPVLSRCRGRLGQFAILGNHDIHHHPAVLRAELARAGFEDVDGRWARIDAEGAGASLAIGGTSAPWGPKLDPSTRPEADFRLVLSHTPDLFSNSQGWGANLVLAGHNHAGQIRLPVLGPILMPSRYGRRYDQGFFREGGALLYVGRGVSGKHPIRYGCPPEVARLVLHAPKPASAFPPRHGASRRRSWAPFAVAGEDCGRAEP